jgi:hypothetical protein
MAHTYNRKVFLGVWRSSKSAIVAARRLGIAPSVARSRACYLRAHGTNLKKMQSGRRP